MKTILITGGAGFIGTNLTIKLLENPNNRVIGLDNFSTGSARNIDLFKESKNYKFIEHDIINPIELEVDEIYNLACPASPPKYQIDPLFTLKTSFLGTLNCLNIAKSNKARLLHSSTSEIYGDPLVHPQDENYWGNVNSLGPRSCYDEGKRVAETLCQEYFLKYNLNIKIVRIFNTYGPYMDKADGRVVSNFINQSLKGNDITIYGDGTQTRSFQYIDDLIKGLMSYMLIEEPFLGPINLGNPFEFTILELAQKIVSLTKTSSKLEYKNLPVDDPTKRQPDIARASKILNGWRPIIELDEGLKKTIQYFENLE